MFFWPRYDLVKEDFLFFLLFCLGPLSLGYFILSFTHLQQISKDVNSKLKSADVVNQRTRVY